ncbi:MAG: hypothetical protein KZQ98_12250 [Candidatus Thiodiazotropha sp. (ex Lucinoma borealis)]|nr:hypothetical protein [Candidatus Thiodiazotropha sp. (ex Lucinoma borealis)]
MEVRTAHQNSFLSEASYADFDTIGAITQTDVENALIARGFSNTQAADFITHWRVAHHLPNTDTGFSATIFESVDNPGEIVFAMRGTETGWQFGEDVLLTDIADIGADGIALKQAIDLFNYYQRLITANGSEVSQYAVYEGILQPPQGIMEFIQLDEGNGAVSAPRYRYLVSAGSVTGLGVMPSSTSTFDVTGHSLGGHLALIMSRLDPSRVGEVYTYNAPGFDTGMIGSDDTEWFFRAMGEIETNETGGTTVGNFPVTRIDNLVAPGDVVSEIGMIPGDITPYFSEGSGPASAHSISNASDALAICNILAALDPSVDLTDDLTPILDAASNRGNESLERIVHSLSDLLINPIDVPIDEREPLYQAIQTLETELFVDRTAANPQLKPQYQGLRIVPLTEHTRTGLVDLANDNIAYRYALMHLNPFAVTGRDDLYDRHNDMDQLERYEETTQEGELTQSNLQDRAEFLVLLNQMNLNDASVSGRRREFNELEQEILASVQSTDGGAEAYQRYHFGRESAPNNADEMPGGRNHDHLYGSMGNDLLTGNAGNDYLEGNAGIDTLNGNEGDDELRGGAGDDGGSNHGLYGGIGDDALYGEAGNDTLDGGVGRDLLIGGNGEDILEGGDGIDILYGGFSYRDETSNEIVMVDDGASNTLRGGDGDDLYFASTGDVISDADGKGLVCVKVTAGNGEEVYVQLGLGPIRGPGEPNVFVEYNEYYDTTITYTLVGDTLHINDSVKIENFTNGDLSIGLGYGSSFWYRFDSYWWSWFTESGPGTSIRNSYEQFYASYDVPWEADLPLGASRQTPGNRFIPISWEEVIGENEPPVIEDTEDPPVIEDAEDPVNGTDQDDDITGDSGDDDIRGDNGDDTISGNEGNDRVDGEDGNDTISGDGGDGGDDVLVGGDGDDSLDGGIGIDHLAGGRGNDRLSGGPGDGDILEGGRGNDMYLYATGDGNIIINNYDTDQGRHDVLQFLAGIEPSDVSVNRSDDNLHLTLQDSGEVITVLNYFLDGGESHYRLDVIEFADGTQWDQATVMAWIHENGDGDDLIEGTDGDDTLDGRGGHDRLNGAAGNDTLSGGAENDNIYGDSGDDSLIGDAGNDRLFGGSGNDTLRGGAGDDELSGGEGNDTYLFALGDGSVTIRNRDVGGGHNDVLRFFEGIAPSDVTISRAGSELLLFFPSSEESITVSGYFANDGSGGHALGAIEFADGTVWELEQILTRLPQATEGDDTLYGYAADDSLDGLQGNDRLYGYAGNDTLNGSQGDDYLFGGGGNDILTGGEGSDTLFADDGDDTLRGGAGDADSLIGGQGNDTYLYGMEDGNVYIENVNFGSNQYHDTLRFLEGIETSDVEVTRNWHDLFITILASGIEIRVKDYFNPYSDSRNGENLSLEFPDGTQWDYDRVFQLTQQATEEDDNLYSQAGGDTLDGLDGDDNLYGSGGDDTLSGNYGVDTLYGSSGNDVLNGDDGDDILYGQTGDDVLNGGDGNDTIYAGNSARFVSSWNGNDTLNGGSGDDHLYGDAGSDTLSGGIGTDTLSGGTGNDIYLYGLGDGDTTINNAYNTMLVHNSGASVTNRDVLRFLDGIAPTDVTISRFNRHPNRPESDALLLTLDNGDVVTVNSFFVDEGSSDFTLQSIEFIDGTSWDAQYIINQIFQGNESTQEADFLYGTEDANTFNGLEGDDKLYGADGDDTLTGGSGNDLILGQNDNDTLYGSTGDDQLIGGFGDDLLIGGEGSDELIGGDGDDELRGSGGNDELVGGSGNDTYSYGRGDGNTVINNLDYSEGRQDVLRFLEGIIPADVSITRSGNNLFLTVDSDDVITVRNYFSGDGENNYVLQAIEFSDGSVWRYEQVAALSMISSEEADTLYGTAGADVLDGLGGDDSLYGAGGNDTLSGGDGQDHLDGGEGDDTLLGGAGIDTLSGGWGDDALRGGVGGGNLTGGGGNDTYLYGQGDGSTVINNLDGSEGSQDVLLFLEGITPSDVVAARNGDSLLLTLSNSDQIRVPNYFLNDGVNDYVLQAIEFADGTTWSYDQVAILSAMGTEEADTLNGTPAADTIDGRGGNDALYGAEGDDHLNGGAGDDRVYGEAGDDILNGNDGRDQLDGGAGNDILRGGAGRDDLTGREGNDTYLYGAGDGYTTISNRDNGEGNRDVLRFLAGITPEELIVRRTDTNSLQLSWLNSDDLINVYGYFQDEGATSQVLSAIEFADGTHWTYEQVEALSMIATEAADEMHGTVSTDTMEGLGGADNLYGGEGDDILDGGTGNDYVHGEEGHDRVSGGVGDDYLYGGNGNDILAGGGGSDHLYGQEGNDTYLYVAGDGDITINNQETGEAYHDVLRFLQGINPDEVKVTNSNNDLLLTLADNGDVITVLNYFMNEGVNNYLLQAIEFADGSTWSYEQVERLSMMGTDGADDIYGTTHDDPMMSGGAGDDYLLGGEGDDLLFGGSDNDFLFGQADSDYLEGGAGNDFLFGHQDLPNHNEIKEPREFIEYDEYGWDTWNHSLWVLRQGNQYDVLRGGAGSDVVVGHGELDGGLGDDKLLGVGLLSGGEGNDLIIAYTSAYWTYEPGPSNAYTDYYHSVMDRTVIRGGRGNDELYGNRWTTYVFEQGDGQDTIRNERNNQGGEQCIEFRGHISASDVRFERQGGDLIVHYGDANDQITITDWFTPEVSSGGSTTLPGKIDRFEFSDGTVITLSEAEAGLTNSSDTDEVIPNDLPADEDRVLVGDDGYDVLMGGTGNDTLEGHGGINHLSGMDGNDTLRGGSGVSNLRGGEGDDTYLYGVGDHDCFIINNDLQGGVDVLRFLEGITPDDLSMTRDRTNLVLTVNGGVITVVSYFQNQGDNSDALNTIEFADGTSWDYDDVMPHLTLGTQDANELYGDAIDDQFNGLAGDDTLFGAGGDDQLRGDEGGDRLYGETGNDTLDGGADNDWLYGGSGSDVQHGDDGDDILLGGLGDDALQGGAGDDRYYYSFGDGRDIIDNTGGGNDRLCFTDLTLDRLSFSQDGDDLVVLVDGDLNQSIRVVNHYLGGDAEIDAILPSEGDALSAAELVALLTPLPDTGSRVTDPVDQTGDTGSVDTPVDENPVTDTGDSTPDQGTADPVTPQLGGDDALVGSGADEVLIAGTGNDTLTAGLGNDELLGGVGDDTYVYTGGQDTLEDTAGTDLLRFENGITFNQVASGLRKSGDDLVLRVDGGPDQITLTDFFLGGDYLVETIEFATGGSLTAEQIFGAFGLAVRSAQSDFVQTVTGSSTDDAALSGGDQADLIQGYNGDDALLGNSGDDRLVGGNGADSLTGGTGNDVLSGGRGDDIYVFMAGDGEDLIDNLGGGFDTLQFEGIDFNQVASGLMKSGDDLILQVSGGTDQITLLDFFQGGDHAVDQLTFASGGAISAEQIFGVFGLNNPDPLGSPDYQGVPDEWGYATATHGDGASENYLASSGDDLIDAGAGDDRIQGHAGDDYLIGGYGSDVYLIGSNAGQDTINNYDADDSGTDTVHFEVAAVEDLWFSRDGNDLAITLAGSEDQLTLAHWYDSPANEVDRIEADGSVLLNNQVDQLVAAMASYDVPAGVGNVIPQDVQDTLQPILAENWQAIA